MVLVVVAGRVSRSTSSITSTAESATMGTTCISTTSPSSHTRVAAITASAATQFAQGRVG